MTKGSDGGDTVTLPPGEAQRLADQGALVTFLVRNDTSGKLKAAVNALRDNPDMPLTDFEIAVGGIVEQNPQIRDSQTTREFMEKSFGDLSNQENFRPLAEAVTSAMVSSEKAVDRLSRLGPRQAARSGATR